MVFWTFRKFYAQKQEYNGSIILTHIRVNVTAGYLNGFLVATAFAISPHVHRTFIYRLSLALTQPKLAELCDAIMLFTATGAVSGK